MIVQLIPYLLLNFFFVGGSFLGCFCLIGLVLIFFFKNSNPIG